MLGFRQFQREPIYYTTTLVLVVLITISLAFILMIIEAVTLFVNLARYLHKKIDYHFMNEPAKRAIRLEKLKTKMDNQWEIISNEQNNL